MILVTDDYSWSDPAKKIEAAAHCRWVFDRLFPHLCEALNGAHEESRSPAYWRIIIGPWFFHRVMARYEQYSDPKCEFKSLDPVWMKARPDGLVGKLRNAYAAALDLVGRTRPVILCDLHMSHRDVWRIALASGFRAWPMVRRSPRPESFRADDATRVRLRRHVWPWGADEFENLVLSDLVEAVPDIYVERYRAFRDWCAGFVRRRQRLLVSAHGWKSNERLKFIAALEQEYGAKIAAAQHGANTGWGILHSLEDFTRDTADVFITWGVRENVPKAIPLPDPILNRLRRIAMQSGRSLGMALFVGTSFPRYASAGIRTQPMARQTLDYMDGQGRFFKAIGDRSTDFLVRTYPADHGWQNKVRLLQDFPRLNLDHFERGVLYHLRRCRLAVIDNPQTTFLEALALDKPTVLYFDPELWKMNETAEARFGALAKAGIVHFTPEAAAAHVLRVWDDPRKWWNGWSVSMARMQFMGWAVRLSRRWPKRWAEALGDIAR